MRSRPWTRILKAFTDMLIFPPLSLSFSSFQNQIAHLQTIPEKKKLVPPGSSACSCRLFFTRRSRTPFYSIEFCRETRANERCSRSIDREHRVMWSVASARRERAARERNRHAVAAAADGDSARSRARRRWRRRDARARQHDLSVRVWHRAHRERGRGRADVCGTSAGYARN